MTPIGAVLIIAAVLAVIYIPKLIIEEVRKYFVKPVREEGEEDLTQIMRDYSPGTMSSNF